MFSLLVVDNDKMTLLRSMNPERWIRVADVYHSVIEVCPESREKKLHEACGDDKDLFCEVQSLLEARDEAGSFLCPEDLRAHIRELSEPDVVPGKTFGRYEILSLLGAGGMGQVYLARDRELERQVALKVLPLQFTLDEECIQRFRREARAASALNHPNIVTVYDVGANGQTWYIATEFIEGKTLRKWMEAGEFETGKALDVALQCARALAVAHRANIVHHDVKPENILVRRDGVVKIVDFGLARGIEEPSEDGNDTGVGTVMGTPRYMSPEQARGERLDARADIFSLGAVLYEMVTGQPAFPGVTTTEMVAAVLTHEPKKTSSDLDSILDKALAKIREERYRTMDEFAADLQRFGERPARFSDDASPAGKARLSRRGLLTGAGTLAAGAGMVAFYWKTTRSESREAPPVSILPLTSFPGFKNYGSFSPDERRIVFSWNGGSGGSGGKQERNIYVKNIGNGDPVRLTFADADETHPAWSPDSSLIAFCRLTNDELPFRQFAVMVISSDRGPESQIWAGSEGVSWSPDGNSLAVSGLPPQAGGIVRVGLRTGVRTRLTRSGNHLDELPIFSPDGKWVVFSRSFGPRTRELFVVSANGRFERQLTFDHQPTYGATWTADSREVVFSSNRASGGETLWRIPVEGGTPRRLSATLAGAFYPAISKNGDRLIYTEAFLDTNIYSSTGSGFGERPTPARFGKTTVLIRSSRRDDSPSISKGQNRIAFVSRRTGNEEIWRCELDGSKPKQLTSFRGPEAGSPRWSPDGNRIVFDSVATGTSDIYVVDAEGGAPRRLTSELAGHYMPSWSASGKLIYFKSDRSGSDQIWSVPADGGPLTQVTRGGGCEPCESSDGKMLYYTNHGWGTIWSMPTGGGAEQPVPELQSFDRIFRSWGLVKQGIYFMSRADKPEQMVHFFSFSTRRVYPLLTFDREPIWNYPDLALSEDGRVLLTARLDQEANDIMLIENFR